MKHPAGPAGRAPAQGTRAPRPPASKPSGAKKWLQISVIVLALGIGGYFGTIQILKWQERVNEKSRKEAANSDGGELGHIANVYGALDATDPDKQALGTSTSQEAQFRARYGTSLRTAADPTASAPEKQLPILPAVWTLDLAAAKIPEGRANGTISGTNFVYETARLDATATAVVLSLRQGTNASPDGEILVYLHPKPGEKIGGGSWNINKEMKGSAVPQVAKRWKPNPKYAATMKSFPAGYAMKLELGSITNSQLTGKIFVALPDVEQTVVAGIFKAGTSLPDTGDGSAPVIQTANPVSAPPRPPPTRPGTLPDRYRSPR